MQNRREFLKRGLVAAGLLRAPRLLARATGGGQPKGQPNVLFIMTDQQFGDAMSCRMGTKYIHTPAMDGLAENGTLFGRAYSPNPLCMPARGSIFTGRYPHETGVTHNQFVKVDPADFVCMGTYFRKAGYQTAYFGKWHLCYREKDIDSHGFEVMGSSGGGGRDERATEAAVKFLSAKHDKPFLAVVSLLNPHNICEFSRGQRLPCGPIGEPPPPDQCPPAPVNLEPPAGETDTMTLMRKGYHANRLFPVGGFSSDKWRQYRWGYCRMIEKVDALIGRALDALRKAGLEDNTLVIFTSDHGECAGAHRFNQKTVLYEESARVPLIVSLKGKTPKAACDKLVNTGTDLLVTMLDCAGIPVPAKLTGRSLWPIAAGRTPTQWRDHVVIENDMVQTGRVGDITPKCQGRMVRSERYKYCIYEYGTHRESLVDLQSDPLETKNLAGEAAHRSTVMAHRKLLSAFAAKHEDKVAAALLANDVAPRPFAPGRSAKGDTQG